MVIKAYKSLRYRCLRSRSVWTGAWAFQNTKKHQISLKFNTKILNLFISPLVQQQQHRHENRYGNTEGQKRHIQNSKGFGPGSNGAEQYEKYIRTFDSYKVNTLRLGLDPAWSQLGPGLDPALT
ncbi:hypothetical protein NQD34_014721 [Periophthalmus magnuspinnatus]|nr:hypothetical protein NQD34_014721 [Periophthalmus magnuspinnatus]